MLAGILVLVLFVAGLGYAVPWIMRHRDDEAMEEPTERFSHTMQILTRDCADEEDPSCVSTPLTRSSERYGLHMTAKQAARRRLVVLCVLSGTTIVLGALSGVGTFPWWSALIPAALIVAFIAVARVSVVRMHRRLDAYAVSLDKGFRDDEDTVTLNLEEPEEQSTEFSVDLTAPKSGVTWDPVPVTTPTYVSKPLMPRTVRTIDLSAPVASTPLIPTAEHPHEPVSEESIPPLRRVVGE